MILQMKYFDKLMENIEFYAAICAVVFFCFVMLVIVKDSRNNKELNEQNNIGD